MSNSYQNLELCHPPRFYRQWEVIKNPSNFINNLIGQIEKYISLQNTPICDAYGINFHKYHVNNFIHCSNLQKNEEIVKQILAKYNLKIMRYCCGGDGCELRQIKKK